MSLDYAEAVRLIKRGRRSERRGKAIQKVISGLIVAFVSNLLTGWYLMLAVGIAHAEWTHRLPTIGYWWACLLVALTRPLFNAATSKSDD